MRADLGPRLERLDCPLGVIWGRRDRVVPIETLERVRAVRPEVAVEILEDAAHVPQLECPEEYIAALDRIFERLTAR
jgi:pimeloyl-ACP methyl ester carboxylesterase